LASALFLSYPPGSYPARVITSLVRSPLTLFDNLSKPKPKIIRGKASIPLLKLYRKFMVKACLHNFSFFMIVG
jgi:hypothetical protein